MSEGNDSAADDEDIDAPPLTCPASSFVCEPSLDDAVEVGYEHPKLHGPTGDPNRYTVHVPTETTRLSLGEKSGRWNTDPGIVGYTDSHVHFEVKTHDKTVMSLGGPATTSAITGHGGTPPVATHGYSMVTEQRAWHDAKESHDLVSRTGDISLRTMAGKHAVVQSDTGSVDLNGGKEVNLSGGGVAIGAGELELEDVRYGGEWEGKGPHSVAASGARIAGAVAAGTAALHNLIFFKGRPSYAEGAFAETPAVWMGRAKFLLAAGIFGASVVKVKSLVSAKDSPPMCVKLDAAKKLTFMAGRDVSVYGVTGASLGASGWTTVGAGVSATLTGMVYCGVAGSFVSDKGYRKAEVASDWGDVVVGAKKEIHMAGEHDLLASAAKVAHVASPGHNGAVALGGKEKAFMGTPDGGGWGVLLDDEGLAIGKATSAGEMKSAKIAATPSLRVKTSSITLASKHVTTKLEGSMCQIESKKHIRFEASGPATINGAKILLK
jgi:hypothetical protein